MFRFLFLSMLALACAAKPTNPFMNVLERAKKMSEVSRRARFLDDESDLKCLGHFVKMMELVAKEECSSLFSAMDTEDSCGNSDFDASMISIMCEGDGTSCMQQIMEIQSDVENDCSPTGPCDCADEEACVNGVCVTACIEETAETACCFADGETCNYPGASSDSAGACYDLEDPPVPDDEVNSNAAMAAMCTKNEAGDYCFGLLDSLSDSSGGVYCDAMQRIGCCYGTIMSMMGDGSNEVATQMCGLDTKACFGHGSDCMHNQDCPMECFCDLGKGRRGSLRHLLFARSAGVCDCS